MNRILMLLMVAALATAVQATDISSSFGNMDFETGGVSNPFQGFDDPDILEWDNYPAGPMGDGGVEGSGAWWGTYAGNSAFMFSPGAATNMSSYVIQAGDVFNVAFMAKDYSDPWFTASQGEWTVSFYYDDPANVIGSYSTGIMNTAVWSPYVSGGIAATPESIGGTLGILLASTGSSVAMIDEVTVALVRLENNSPADGATQISTILTDADNDLVFTVYDPVLGANDIDVYMSVSDANVPDLITTITAPGVGQQTVDLTGLAADLSFETTYYWKVVCYEPNLISGLDPVSGPVWSFTTAGNKPVVKESPAGTGDFEGGSVEFVAVFQSSETVTIEWFKDDDSPVTEADPDVTIVNNTVDVITTSTLTISNLDADDEGGYYAKATNINGSESSEIAVLQLKKLLAYWPFEGDPNDASGNEIDGTVMGEVTYDAGQVGQALVLNGSGANYIDLPDGFDNFATNGLTISVWAKPATAANWANFIQFSNGAPSDNIFFCRSGTSQTLWFRTANGTAQNTGIGGNAAINLDQWQMFTVTLDASGVARLYKNGARYFYYNNNGSINTPQVTMPMPNNITRINNYIGKSAWADANYNGMLDEIRIYTYALTDDEIAAQYYADSGLGACQAKPDADLSGDCKVNLDDFALLAGEWLECGLYPVETCN